MRNMHKPERENVINCRHYMDLDARYFHENNSAGIDGRLSGGSCMRRHVSAVPNWCQQNLFVANTTLEAAHVCLSVPNRKLVQPIVPFCCC